MRKPLISPLQRPPLGKTAEETEGQEGSLPPAGRTAMEGRSKTGVQVCPTPKLWLGSWRNLIPPGSNDIKHSSVP